MKALIALVVALALFTPPASPVSAAAFDVNQTTDEVDGAIGDGLCDTNLMSGGSQCTLRAAIQEANFTVAADQITFSIGGGGVQTIAVGAAALPAISQPVDIDGTTQEGFAGDPLIVLDGAAQVAGSGLTISTSNSTIKSLVIVDFPSSGVLFSAGSGNAITGSYVGMASDGVTADGNGTTGVSVGNSDSNEVGGSGAGEGNLIAGNAAAQVAVSSAGADGNIVQGNLIGVDVTGLTAVPLGTVRVSVSSATNTQIGGTAGVTVGGPCTGACNVIGGGASNHAVLIANMGASGNVVEGNYIGVGVDGTTDVSGPNNGVSIQNSADLTRVGGTTPEARNVIAGAAQVGVHLFNVTNTTIVGNYIGTDVSGTLDMGNALSGVDVTGTSANTAVGDDVAGAGNLIAGNNGAGVSVASSGSGNVVVNNVIGRPWGGPGAANGSHGVDAASPATIGSDDPQFGNVIAGNGGHGVHVFAGTGIRILGNSIYANGTSGIDLFAGGNANDANDPDVGANDLQNFPVITNVNVAGGQTTIDGTLNSESVQIYEVRLFANVVCDGGNRGEGQRYLGKVTTGQTNMAGDVNWQAVLTGEVVAGQWITATAMDANGNTSQFSTCFRVTPVPDCNGLPATMVGFAGAEVIEGTSGPDVITGFTGADTIDGLAGDDTICGQKGGDTLSGGIGFDTLIGATGDDHLVGGADGDTLVGGDAVDTLEGGPGNDDIEGNDQADTLFGNEDDDLLKGGKGNDGLDGGPGVLDVCNGNTGNADGAIDCETTTNVP
jgi:CSLREA domain-containing protein